MKQIRELTLAFLMKQISIDKYKRGNKLGNGTFGIIYVLVDQNNTEKYAAKEIIF